MQQSRGDVFVCVYDPPRYVRIRFSPCLRCVYNMAKFEFIHGVSMCFVLCVCYVVSMSERYLIRESPLQSDPIQNTGVSMGSPQLHLRPRKMID